jgi:chaperonin GroES
MKLHPQRDRILVEVEEPPTVSPGGIILLPPKEEARQSIGKVLAVGPGKFDAKGRRQAMPVKVGERVAFSKFGHSTPPGSPGLRILSWESVHYVCDI